MGIDSGGKGREARIHQEFEVHCVINGRQGVARRTAPGDSGNIWERGDVCPRDRNRVSDEEELVGSEGSEVGARWRGIVRRSLWIYVKVNEVLGFVGYHYPSNSP